MKDRGKQIILIGDIHSDFKTVMVYIATRQITDTIFIQVGDFGMGFLNKHEDESNLNVLNDHLKKANNFLYAIRGNHDKPEFFNGDYKLSNLSLLPDYSIIEINGENILFVGGAVSIDRRPRLNEMQQSAIYGRDIELYWFDEIFNLDENLLKEMRNIDHVITHSSPKFAWPNNQVLGYAPIVHTFAKNDSKLYDDLDNERDKITKMHNILSTNNKIKTWSYGHFHRSETEYHFDTKFVLLGVNEFKEVF